MEALNLASITPVWQQLQVAVTPIEDDQQHAQVLELLQPIWDAVGEDGAHPLGSLLRLMLEHIQIYEERRWPIPAGDGAANLRYVMELRGLSQRALAEETGIEQASISRLVNGKRAFTTDHIRTLAAYFKVDAGLFL